MRKLFNLSTHEMDLQKFECKHDIMNCFINKYGFDGIEMIQSGEWNEGLIPSKLITGFHMRFWPVWLDFWKGSKDKLINQFGSMEFVESFYGGDTKDAMVQYYKRELEVASKIGVKYVVFHISNVLPEHCFSYDFTYTDKEVLEAGIELINMVFDGFEGNLEVLFENLWWPGLKLTDKSDAEDFFSRINYQRKGFMLDISHMMNTNLKLGSEDEAVEYILSKLQGLGDLAAHIKGIHLNSSITGEYVRSQLDNKSLQDEEDFMKKYCDSYLHVLKIDRHEPFRSSSINRVLDFVKPEYLVYEFLTEDISKLEAYCELQNSVLR